jgi:uncharacterized membrane protein
MGACSVRGCEPAGDAMIRCSCSTSRLIIFPVGGVARFRKMNTPALMPDTEVTQKKNNPRTMEAAQASIVVNAAVAAVYARWVTFEDYPKFITVMKCVRRLDENHFSALLSFNGKAHETKLEVMLRVPGRRMAWRTIADQRAPDHFAAGVVSFVPLSDRRTGITLKLASSFGGAVSSRIDRYLHNFKRLIENG